MKMCKVCRKKPRLGRRVNNEGILFCSDDCYEAFEDSPNDMDHPYIDDYDAVRFEYMEWTGRYEQKLMSAAGRNLQAVKEELVEGIESVIEEFRDYVSLEGTDGVFSAEIYEYLQELENLTVVIERWTPGKRSKKATS
ncbi:hypothetical protein P6P90_15885 [Ectobacillus antri]|uniref:TRASH domain-containing protein n=1 Tax=Ectobacillus antri TaxID=2486280 RepID=A0ABT6H804_9BACI|nr:hypothetical protein [Ectobacillus antri]MDG4658340.1 hypothetical protein [Ectobacillus antri]MDG5755383.1 hypothetical protein [Ectobacillus antri]